MLNCFEEFLCLLIFVGFRILLSGAWQQEAVLDSEGLVSLYWTVDVKKNVFLFELTGKTRGYIGLGLSPFGTMVDADIMIGFVNSEGKAEVNDYWGLVNGPPHLDAKHDWKLLEGRENASHTMLRIRRQLTPGDGKDAIIFDFPTWVIWAWHKEDPNPSNLHYHGRNRGALQVCLIRPDCWPQNTSSGALAALTKERAFFAYKELSYFLDPLFYSVISFCLRFIN